MGGRNGCDGHEPASGQVVYKVGFPVGAKRRVLSGSFGTAGVVERQFRHGGVVKWLQSMDHDLSRLSAPARRILQLLKYSVYAGIVP